MEMIQETAHSVTMDDVLQSFRACGPLFAALGDPARQDIILLLANKERLNVGQITEAMHLSRPAISHHLKALLQAGILKMERESRENFYSLDIDPALLIMKQMIEQVEIVCTERQARLQK